MKRSLRIQESLRGGGWSWRNIPRFRPFLLIPKTVSVGAVRVVNFLQTSLPSADRPWANTASIYVGANHHPGVIDSVDRGALRSLDPDRGGK